MSDLAAFDRSDILAVYGERPKCFLTLHWMWVDASHILGHGYAFGAGGKSPEREIFSSIYNCAPLQRDVHKGPQRDSVEMRHLLLRLAHDAAEDAVQSDRYVKKENDLRFLLFAQEWMQANPVLSPY